MADPGINDGRETSPSDGRRGRRTRAWLAVVLVLAVAVAAFAAYAGGVGSGSPGDASPASLAPPSTQGSATAPAQAAASPPLSAASSSPLAVSQSPSARPPVSLAAGVIAMVDDSGALATYDARGSRVEYPAPGVVFGFPAWSPDGSRIAVVGQSTSYVAIYVFTVNRAGGAASKPAVIYRSPDRPPFYLYWAPDSRHVGFLTTEPAGLALRVAPIDGSAPLNGNDLGSIVLRGAPLYFQWVDAGHLLLHVGSGSDAFVGQVTRDGTTVGAPVAATGPFRPAILSHDGRYLAYSISGTGAAGTVVLETAQGSASQRLAVLGPPAMLFDPTGDTLATIGADTPDAGAFPLPRGPLRLIDPASGAVRTLLDGSVVAFFWAPDGRTIAALRLVTPGQGPAAFLGRATVAEAEFLDREAMVTGAAPGSAMALSFVDVSTGKLRAERAVSVGDAFVQQLLPYFDQYALSHPLWSPDSSAFLLPVVAPSGQDELAIIPADGSDPALIAGGAMGSWSP